MIVLSLCDGMSCGRMALEKLNIPIEKYFASEIKDIAIKNSMENFPDNIQIGDVNKISYSDGVLHTEKGDFETSIDLVIFGSPCQSYSVAMKKDKRIGLEDKERSGLFLECHRILNEVKPKYFLMENVVMKKDDQQVITDMLGVKPVRINSSLLTAQLRDRLYWTNIPNVTVPEDQHITLSDILIDGYTPKVKARCLMKNDSHGYYNGCGYTPVKKFFRWYYRNFTSLVFPTKEDFEKCLEIYNKTIEGKTPAASLFDSYTGTDFDCLRFLWKEERARLQGVPEEYVKNLNEQEAADLLGDGWTVPVIVHLFKGLQDEYSLK